MTKEQAIKELNSLIKVNKDFFENQGNMLINKRDIEAIETVLNMLKDLQKKNKRLTQTNKSYKGMIKKKDKQIDLMAKAMDKIQDPQVCKYCDNKINLNHGYCIDAGKCKEGIKQYFKEIAKRKSEEC